MLRLDRWFFRVSNCLILIVFGAAGAFAQETVRIGRDARGFHEDQFNSVSIKLEAPAVNDVEILVELIGIPNLSKINELRLQIRRSIGIQNALAFEANRFSSIAYDPDWAKMATPEFYLVLGHEAGHLFCRHTTDSVGASRIQQELEADRFGGASIRRFEAYHGRSFFPAVLVAAMRRYPERGSDLYPPRLARIEALKQGYESGSSCGNLAPVLQQGFVQPGSRR